MSREREREFGDDDDAVVAGDVCDCLVARKGGVDPTFLSFWVQKVSNKRYVDSDISEREFIL